MPEETTVRTDVPTAAHPDMLLPLQSVLDVEGTPGKAAYEAGRDALRVCYDGMAALADAEKALCSGAKEHRLYRGEMVPVHGREAELAEAANAGLSRALRLADGHLSVIRAKQTGLREMLDAMTHLPAGADPAVLQQATEIRAHVREMSADDRRGFLDEAVKQEDRQTVAAIVSAPAFLSGMTRDGLDLLRQQAQHAWAPEAAAQRDACEKVGDRWVQAWVAFMERARDLGKLAEATKPTTPEPKPSADDALQALTGA